MTASTPAADPCPSWCQLSGHAAHAGAAGGITHRRVVGEIRLAGTEPVQDEPGRPVVVAVEAYTDPDGCQYAPAVMLAVPGVGDSEPASVDLTPAEARDMAGKLLEAARLAGS